MREFITTFKVRSYECDSYGHVNNAVYLNYLEFARMSALFENGFTLDKMKEKGYLVFVKKIEIEYRNPLYQDDEISVKTFTSESRNTSGTFTQQIFRKDEDQPAAEAKVTWVFTNFKGKPIPIPAEIREAFDIK
ncbi:MAG: acyl-CoA thioesterase [Calditrichia bacterium]|nr:acyl-CoA thioesterase [Calditrichia bacterium]